MLYTAINKGDWPGADAQLAGLSPDVVETLLPWWRDLYQKGDAEGLLVLAWLKSHGLYSAALPLAPAECAKQLCEAYSGIPAWLVDKLSQAGAN